MEKIIRKIEYCIQNVTEMVITIDAAGVGTTSVFAPDMVEELDDGFIVFYNQDIYSITGTIVDEPDENLFVIANGDTTVEIQFIV